MKRRSLMLLGGSLYLLGVAQYLTAQLYVAAAWNPPYDWIANYISDLGNTRCAMFALPHATPAWVCSPRHAVMNAAFIASGMLLTAGTIALRRFWPMRTATRCAVVLLLIAGCGKIMVGAVAENERIAVHSTGALNIPIESLAILLISAAVFRERRTLAYVGFVTFVLGILGTTLSILAQLAGPSFLLGLGAGGMERLAGYPSSAWMVGTGIVAVIDVLRSRRLHDGAFV